MRMLVPALALLAGCMTRNSFAEESTTLVCDKVRTCAGDAGFTLAGYDSYDDCIDERTRSAEDGLDENSCEVFDAEQAQACLDAVEAASCSGFVSAILTGTLDSCETVCSEATE